MLRLGDLGGNPHVGVFCAANEAIALVAEPVEQRVIDDLREVLGVEVILTTVAGSSVVGSLVAMNSSGIVFSNLAEQHELARIPPSLRVDFMPAKVNGSSHSRGSKSLAGNLPPLGLFRAGRGSARNFLHR